MSAAIIADPGPLPALWLGVHAEALLRFPRRYLLGLWWLLIGKRLRGRNTLAGLTGSSRLAYRLWMAQHEQRLAPPLPHLTGQRVIVAVAADADPNGLTSTMASLAAAPAGIKVFSVGSAEGREELLAALSRNMDGILIPVTAGDRIADGAIARLAAAALETGAVTYADDDLIDAAGRRHSAHFKPDWNAELFQHHDFISGAAALPISQAVLAELSAAGDDWVGRVTRAAIGSTPTAPHHLPAVAIHRQRRPLPVLPPRPTAAAGCDTLVTVIIPTRDQLPLLRTCLDGLERTAHRRIECLIVDNGSIEPPTLRFLADLDRHRYSVLHLPGPFNYAALNNAAVAQAQGEYLCFLNNDVAMIEPDWLHILLCAARRAEVGAVGPRLLYPDDTIQHAGIVLGVGGGAAHAHRGQSRDAPGYFQRAHLPQFVSAVTGACLVVARDKFNAVGGFDAEAFAVAFNDVDLCLRLNARGWQSLYDPRAELIHHESKSRGQDLTPEKKARFSGELALLKARWHTDSKVDPFHHPALSPFSDTFVVRV